MFVLTQGIVIHTKSYTIKSLPVYIHTIQQVFKYRNSTFADCGKDFNFMLLIYNFQNMNTGRQQLLFLFIFARFCPKASPTTICPFLEYPHYVFN